MKLFYAFVCMVCGLWLLYCSKRRRFDRTNPYGVEDFKNYRSKIIATSVEKAAWNVGVVLTLLGGLLSL